MLMTGEVELGSIGATAANRKTSWNEDAVVEPRAPRRIWGRKLK